MDGFRTRLQDHGIKRKIIKIELYYVYFKILCRQIYLLKYESNVCVFESKEKVFKK